MIRKITNLKELTKIEISNLNKFKNLHPEEKINIYYITEFNLGCGYTIFATTLEVNNNTDLQKLNNQNSRDITDIDNLLDNF